MRGRVQLAWSAAALLLGCLAGCGGEVEAPAEAAAPVSGQYDVSGVTIDRGSGDQRPIQGRVVLDIQGGRYTASFELNTPYPGSDASGAKVVGTGEGLVQGNRLIGTADTQIVLSNVPGVDAGFAMIPHQVGPRLTSSAIAEFFADGSVRIDLENTPVPGSDYSPTHTTLAGNLVGAGRS